MGINKKLLQPPEKNASKANYIVFSPNKFFENQQKLTLHFMKNLLQMKSSASPETSIKLIKHLRNSLKIKTNDLE